MAVPSLCSPCHTQCVYDSLKPKQAEPTPLFLSHVATQIQPRSRQPLRRKPTRTPTTYLNNVNPEVKYIGSVLSGTFASIPSTGALQDVGANIAEGSEINQRIGRTVKLRALSLFGTILGGQTNLATDDKYNTVRITVFEGVPGLAAAGIAWSLSAVADPRTAGGVHRILHDQIITLQSPGRDSTGYMPAQKQIRFRVPLTGLMTFYGAAAGTQSNRTIYVYMISDSAVVPNPGFVSGVASLSWIED